MRELVSTLQFSGAFTATFLAIAIYLVARNHDRIDLLLAWILLLIGVVLLRTGIAVSGLMVHYPHQLGVLFPLTYLIGPLLLFYSRSKLTEQPFSWRRFWPHMLPLLGSYIMMVPVFLLPIERKLSYIALTAQPNLLQRAFAQFPFSSAVNLLQLFLVWAILIGYTWGSLRTASALKADTLNSKQQLSRWIYILSVGLMVASILALSSLLVILVFNVVFLSPLLMMTYLSFVIIAGYSAVQLVLRPEFLHRREVNVISDATHLVSDQNEQGKKYENSGLSRDSANALSIQLQRLMKDEALYRHHDLTLQSLAEHLGCSAKHLSQILNEQLSENFYEFTNRYRIDEIKQQLKSGAWTEKPIIDIALDSGFNSKPAFYNAFRKSTGMTPTEYCKQCK